MPGKKVFEPELVGRTKRTCTDNFLFFHRFPDTVPDSPFLEFLETIHHELVT
jgi:hypothetical protein